MKIEKLEKLLDALLIFICYGKKKYGKQADTNSKQDF